MAGEPAAADRRQWARAVLALYDSIPEPELPEMIAALEDPGAAQDYFGLPRAEAGELDRCFTRKPPDFRRAIAILGGGDAA